MRAKPFFGLAFLLSFFCCFGKGPDIIITNGKYSFATQNSGMQMIKGCSPLGQCQTLQLCRRISLQHP